MTREKTKLAMVAAITAFLCAGMTGCGDDEKSGDCSRCPAAQQQECSSNFAECTKGGGSSGDCQQVIDVVCALYGAFDAGGGGDGG